MERLIRQNARSLKQCTDSLEQAAVFWSLYFHFGLALYCIIFPSESPEQTCVNPRPGNVYKSGLCGLLGNTSTNP